MDTVELEQLAKDYQSTASAAERMELAERIIARIGSQVEHFVRRYLFRSNEWEDVVQDVFLRIFKGLGSFSGTGTFEHWWMSIARRACLDLLRKRYGNRIDLVDPHDLAAICGSEFAEPEWKTCQVGLLLDKLSEKCRLLLRLYFFDEMIYREIGETLEKSENAVRMSVKRCLDEARTLFSNHDDSYA